VDEVLNATVRTAVLTHLDYLDSLPVTLTSR
jgi:hypothetical protein